MPNFHACCHAERSRSVKKIIPSFIIHHSQFLIGIFTTFLTLNFASVIAQTLDSLTYKYKANTNQLKEIKDAIGSSISTVDLDNQSSNNYTYDANGQLIADAAEGIQNIDWTVTGKVKKVSIDTNNNGTIDRTLQFKYDGLGNRVKKIVTTGATTVTTYYLHNAVGELISIYNDEGTVINRKEIEIADGSDKVPSLTLVSTTEFERNVGYKNYELKDHLGNMRVVVSDTKEPNSGLTTYNSKLTTSADYYSFGMQMPGRSLNTAEYRWGYQGKEKDDELKGNGNSYDFGARLLDPRVGRWLSIDPKADKYPSESPYGAMGNNPIVNIDNDGRDYTQFTKTIDENGNITYIMKETVAIYVTPEEMASLREEYNGREPDNDLIIEMVETELETTFTGGATRTETLEDGSTRTISIKWSKDADVSVVTDPNEASPEATIISFGYSHIMYLYGAAGLANPLTGNIWIQEGNLTTMLDQHAFGRKQTGPGPLIISHEDGHVSGLFHSHSDWSRITSYLPGGEPGGLVECTDGISHTYDPMSYEDCDTDEGNNHFFGNTFYFTPDQIDKMWRKNGTDGTPEEDDDEMEAEDRRAEFH